MISTIAEALAIDTEYFLREVLIQLETDLNGALEPLERQLASNVTTADVVTQKQHMGYVESWRDRLSRYLMLVAALVQHAKSDEFWLEPAPGEKPPTEIRRDMHRRGLCGGFEAIETRLEHMIDSVDSRVNLCKKLLGIEGEAAVNSRRMGV